MDLKNELQSDETDIILDTIDKLRAQGVGNILKLPQIIVSGDQSSGKSSVLSAISTLKFPIKDGLCTRFATEVIMRPGTPEDIAVSIVPGSKRSEEERLRLELFRHSRVNMNDIENMIEMATAVMGIDPENPRAKRFSDDILRFQITGPNQPALTLVDLPGLFEAPSKDQTEADVNSVRELVLEKYMRNPRSIILAVISATNEFVTQSVTAHSRKVDEAGIRTLGVITKPDKLVPGSDSEKTYIKLAQNKHAPLYQGWHVLMNRDQNNRDNSQERRNDAERKFLSEGAWAEINHNHKGVFKLRSRLSDLLRHQILEELPSLIKDAEQEIDLYKLKRSKLGDRRETPDECRRYLIRAAEKFHIIMRSSINGSYDDEYFDSNDMNANKKRRFRATVQNALEHYSDDMHKHGHAKKIVEGSNVREGGSHQQQITQSEFESEVIELIKDFRGRELTGTYNPMIVRELFQKQSEPWAKLTEDYQKRLWLAADASVNSVLQYVADETTSIKLKRLVIEPNLRKLFNSLDDMTQKLLRSRYKNHPITYNPRFSEDIHRARQIYMEKVFAEEHQEIGHLYGREITPDTLKLIFRRYSAISPTQRAHFDASEIIDTMQAYYKIAMETLVDNFSTLAIEDCLVSQMPGLLSPEAIAALGDDDVSAIAVEPETVAGDRDQIEHKLELCVSALAKLKKIETLCAPGPRLADLQFFPRHAESTIDRNDDQTLELTNGTDLSNLDSTFSDQ